LRSWRWPARALSPASTRTTVTTPTNRTMAASPWTRQRRRSGASTIATTPSASSARRISARRHTTALIATHWMCPARLRAEVCHRTIAFVPRLFHNQPDRDDGMVPRQLPQHPAVLPVGPVLPGMRSSWVHAEVVPGPILRRVRVQLVRRLANSGVRCQRINI
ncbi:hypothetical protein PBRA_000855, partial [Plasmodiophora brassicae]